MDTNEKSRMNLFEAAILPAVPCGAIVGGLLCKSYGVLAAIGGVLVGGIAGFFVGWVYAFVTIFMMTMFTTLWRVARGRSEPSQGSSEEMKNLTRTGSAGITVGIIAAGAGGFFFGWLYGLLFAFVLLMVNAFLAVTREQFRREDRLPNSDLDE
ncbi:MAG: hypothetical protein KAT11_04095 [Phycisphaerae bacterium]|nr:hypothetical protein [Phycisphaerae bacterium]